MQDAFASKAPCEMTCRLPQNFPLDEWDRLLEKSHNARFERPLGAALLASAAVEWAVRGLFKRRSGKAQKGG